MSSSSLYGYTGNVTVSANNLTTLYNAQPGNVVVASVPDRNFTTLYTNQSDISPTKAYGNANVEAFLNAGTDGANSVQNIKMSGNITVGQSANISGNIIVAGTTTLGPATSVHISGGQSGYVLTTNGLGNLIWEAPQGGGGGNSAPYIHFDVSVDGNNQQFTNSELAVYPTANVMNVFKNGVNIEPFYYEKASSQVLQINIPLHAGDTIDVLAENVGGGGGTPGGPPTAVQYNNGYTLSGSSNFEFDETTSTLTVTNISANGAGLSNLIGANVTGYVANATHATVADTANLVNLANYATVANSVAGSNVSGQVNYAAVANSVAGSNVSGAVALATSATTAGTVTASSQPNIHSVGTLASVTANGTVNFTTASNVSLGAVGNVHITGGANTYILTTDGAGNLSWVAPTGATSSIIANGTSNVSIPTTNGNVSISVNGTSNVLTVSNTSVTVAETLTIQQGLEKVTLDAIASTGTVNFDLLTQAILDKTANASGNFTINVRGNSSSTFDSIISTGQSMTCTYINKKNTASPKIMTAFTIDSTSQTVYWSNGQSPTTNIYVYDIYTFNIIKTGSATFTVFGSFGSFN